MKSNFKLLVLICIAAVTTHGQKDQSTSLSIGDTAPPLRIREWIKGTPIQNLEKGRVYVLEFWATWCTPCIAVMPHLSSLARQYKEEVTVIGIDVMEKKTTSLKKVKDFIDSMGTRMDYHVAIEDSNFMVAGWLDASAEQGIPHSFIVNREGKLAWIGHPTELDEVLHKVVNNNWNIREALASRNENKRLDQLDHSFMDTLNEVRQPHSTLALISEIISREPKLKYAPIIAINTFNALLQTNPQKAYEFGKEVLVTSTYEDPPYQLIIDGIKWVSNKKTLPLEIFELGAEAYQIKIDKYGQFGNLDIPMNYSNMAEMYWRAKNKAKAIEAMQKAIEALKNEKVFSWGNMTTFESKLEQYHNM